MQIHSLSEFSVCCHPEILLPWEHDVMTSPLYSGPRLCGRSYSTYLWNVFVLAWEYNWLLALPPLVTPRNDVWGKRLNFHTDDVSEPWSGSAFDWLKQIFLVSQPIRYNIQISVVTHHQCGIFVLILRQHFSEKPVPVVTTGKLSYQYFFRLYMYLCVLKLNFSKITQKTL